MEAKLGSISNRIYWSSLLKAAVFAAAWLFLPFWAFLLIALYLYFVPWFVPGRLMAPFLALLTLAYVQPIPSSGVGAWFALIFGAIFYCILLVKDLLILDRRSMYEVLVLILIFLLLRDFYAAFAVGIGGPGGGGAVLLYAFLLAGAITLLFRNFLGAFPGPTGASERPAVWLVFLLAFQLCVAGLFVPLDFIYQSAAIFLVVALIVDLTAERVFSGPEGLPRTKIFGTVGAILALLVLVLVSAKWGL